MPSLIPKLAFEKLAPRQREIVCHVMRGERNADIAKSLGVGEKTIRLQLTEVYQRLGLYGIQKHQRVLLAVAAYGQGLG